MKYISAFFFISFLFWAASASDFNVSDSSVSSPAIDSITGLSVDTSSSGAEKSFSVDDSPSVSTVSGDSLSKTRDEIQAESSKPSMRLVRRKFDHKHQVFLAAGMMAFIALVMTTAQTWNPN